MGKDTLQVQINGVPQADFADPTNSTHLTAILSGWTLHSGYFTGQGTTKFLLYSEDAAGTTGAMGNLIDDVQVVTVADSTTLTIPVGSAAPASADLTENLQATYSAELATQQPATYNTVGTFDVPMNIFDGNGKLIGQVTSQINVVPTYSLTINYVDSLGRAIASPVTTSYVEGGAYQVVVPEVGDELVTTSKAIYRFIGVRDDSDSTSGTMGKAPRNVFYVYAAEWQEETNDAAGKNSLAGTDGSKKEDAAQKSAGKKSTARKNATTVSSETTATETTSTQLAPVAQLQPQHPICAIPKTGDETNMAHLTIGLLILLIGTLPALAGTVVWRRKKDETK